VFIVDYNIIEENDMITWKKGNHRVCRDRDRGQYKEEEIPRKNSYNTGKM
jgi:hypothetical protein